MVYFDIQGLSKHASLSNIHHEVRIDVFPLNKFFYLFFILFSFTEPSAWL